MSTMRVFHVSDAIIKEPIYLGGKSDNDYGNGFYTTEYDERARSWAALNGKPENSIDRLRKALISFRGIVRMTAIHK